MLHAFVAGWGPGSARFRSGALRRACKYATTPACVQRQASDAEVLSPRSNEAPAADDTSVDPVSIVRSVVGQVKQRYKARQDRDRALSTVTHLPDDVAWRQDEVFLDSDASGSEHSDDKHGRPGSPARGKRWSAEESKTAASAAQVRHPLRRLYSNCLLLEWPCSDPSLGIFSAAELHSSPRRRRLASARTSAPAARPPT